MKRWFIPIALAAVLFMTACTPHSRTEQPQTDAAAENSAIPQEVWAGSAVYEVIPLVPDAGPHAGETLIHNEFIPAGFFTTQEEIIFNDWDPDAYACYTESFDWDGNHLGRSVDVQPEPLALLEDIRADGTRLYVENDLEETCIMTLTTPEGKPTVSYTMPENPGYFSLYAFCGEYIAVAFQETLQLYDMSLQPVQEYTVPKEIDILYDIWNGRLYYQDWYGEIWSLDPEIGGVRQEADFVQVDGWRSGPQNRQHMDFDGHIYDAQEDGIFRYTADADGIYQKPETDAPFLAWEPSGLRLRDVEVLSVLDGDHFFVRFSGLVDEKAVYAVLRKTDEQWKEKQNVTMMLFDMKLAETLRTAAYVFNRENREYRITILESDLKTADPEVAEVVFREFSEGRVPDLLVCNEDMESLYLQLDRQGYLTNLSAFAPRLTGSAKAAVSGANGMKRVPVHIWYNTLAAADTNGGLSSLTAETLLELAASLREGDLLFSDQVYDRLYPVLQSCFVDPAAGKCHFDTPEFRAFLEILQNREAYFSADASIFAEQYTQMLAYQFTDTMLMEDIRSDRVRLVHLPLYNYKALGAAKIAFGERPFSICGYPGVMAVPQFVTSLALPEAASCPEGAKAFLEFLLSDAVQTSSRVVEHAFPVTGSAVDKLLETDWFIFALQFHEEEENGRLYTSAFVDAAEKSTRPDRELWELYAGNGSMQYTIVEYTPSDKAMLRALLDSPGAGQINDPVLQEIIMEEISAWRSGDRTMEDTIRVLQSRAGTYLAEQSSTRGSGG